jgi:predicted nuclease with TOPRIM domain
MAMDIENCRLENERRFTELKLDIQELKDDSKVMQARLDKQAAMVSDIQQLSTSVSILANNMKSMLEEQQKQNERLHQLESKPAKRWDMVIDKIILLVVAAVVGGVLITLGLPA